jgi:hypothetical protein
MLINPSVQKLACTSKNALRLKIELVAEISGSSNIIVA